MTFKAYLHIAITSLFLFFMMPSNADAQKMTRISGRVIDKQTKEPLPFVNIVFADKNIGTITDYNGKFEIQTQWASKQLVASFMGYKDQIKTVVLNASQKLNFQLESKNIKLGEVVVATKKKRYRNKNNPAVDLIREVIRHKGFNRKESLDFYEYDKYEKVEFDLNNITEEFQNRKVFNQFQFIFTYVDTSDINGKPFLPVFLKETRSKVYYRKSPKSQKEFVSGTNMVGFHDYIDSEGVSYMIDNLYQDIDLYDNNVTLLTNEFISPLSNISPIVYKFHILDTVAFEEIDCIKLAFQPRNKADFAFKGEMFITNDGHFSVIDVDMRVSEDINLNFVNDIKINQSFEKVDDKIWMRTKDELVIDFNLGEKGTGIFGKKKTHYDHYLFNQERIDTVYLGIEQLVKSDNHDQRADSFWVENRLTQLTEQESNIYLMTDSVQEIPAFKRTMDVLMLLISGYWNFGPLDVGPVNTFYSFNDVEGLRLKIGGKTSDKFNEKLRLEGYLLYGFKDKEYKYSGQATWSLNGKSLKDNPRHTFSAMYQVETNFPGMNLQYVNEDNVLLSIKRGVADKILYYEMFKFEHFRDWGNGISSSLTLKHVDQEPGGTLFFNYADDEINHIISSEIGARIRFAPNAKSYKGMDYNTPIITRYPIFQLNYAQGLDGVINSNYGYGKLSMSIFKRFYLSPIGYTDFELEGGKVFGEDVPFPLLFVHRANQTYSYQLRSYNLMNFMEFVSDQYVSVFAEHHFNGFFLNKIPLIKKLKWREIITVKGIYGGVSDQNNPNVTDDRMLFPVNDRGEQTTFTLEHTPYVEASIGIGNIFKIFRVDLVKRFTYLDNPSVSEYGIRARFKFDF